MTRHMKEGPLSDQHTAGFTLIELLVVISIIALLIALLLPALQKSRDAAMIALCASRQHQLAAGFHTYGADNGGSLPPGSAYLPEGHVPNRAVRGSGDFLDVLNPAYVEPKEAWYCPAGAFFADTVWSSVTPWTLPTPYANCCIGDGDNVYTSYAFMVNAWAPVGSGPLASNPVYQKIPRHLDDPPDWTLVLDYTLRCSTTVSGCNPGLGEYRLTNHPGSPEGWGTASQAPFAVKPQGTNKCSMDGAVRWKPEAEAVDGYPGCGATPGANFHCVLIE